MSLPTRCRHNYNPSSGFVSEYFWQYFMHIIWILYANDRYYLSFHYFLFLFNRLYYDNNMIGFSEYFHTKYFINLILCHLNTTTTYNVASAINSNIAAQNTCFMRFESTDNYNTLRLRLAAWEDPLLYWSRQTRFHGTKTSDYEPCGSINKSRERYGQYGSSSAKLIKVYTNIVIYKCRFTI